MGSHVVTRGWPEMSSGNSAHFPIKRTFSSSLHPVCLPSGMDDMTQSQPAWTGLCASYHDEYRHKKWSWHDLHSVNISWKSFQALDTSRKFKTDFGILLLGEGSPGMWMLLADPRDNTGRVWLLDHNTRDVWAAENAYRLQKGDLQCWDNVCILIKRTPTHVLRTITSQLRE